MLTTRSERHCRSRPGCTEISPVRRRSCTMIAINIVGTALIVAAADSRSPRPLRSRGRAGMMLLSAALLSVLIVLALQINSEWMTDLDTSVRKWFTTHQGSRGLRSASRQLFAFIGRPLHVAIAAVVSGMLLAWRARSPLRAVVVIGAVGTGAVLERVFKALVTRTPDNLSKLYDASPQDLAQIAEHAHTFPSGHVTGTATLLGMIAVCASVGSSAPCENDMGCLRSVRCAVRCCTYALTFAHTSSPTSSEEWPSVGQSSRQALPSSMPCIQSNVESDPHWVGDCMSRGALRSIRGPAHFAHR